MKTPLEKLTDFTNSFCEITEHNSPFIIVNKDVFKKFEKLIEESKSVDIKGIRITEDGKMFDGLSYTIGDKVINIVVGTRINLG